MIERDLTGLSEDIFLQRYAYPGETKWKERARAIAKHVATAEPDDKIALTEQKFFDMIKTMDFIPGGRIIFGAGRSNYNLLNCFVLNPEDNVESIGKTISDMYKISCAGGGVGFNFSNIRPKGDDIQNIPNSAPGSVSVIKMINEIGDHVRAGKNRRTALMGILEVTHPDMLEFLKVKLDQGQLNNFNISVAITDRFIEAVENDEDWYFTFNNRKYYTYIVTSNEGKDTEHTVKLAALSSEDALGRANLHHRQSFEDNFTKVEESISKAKEIWDYIYQHSVESGDPGIFNISLTNKYTNVSYFEHMPATNPCGEIPLPSYGNCCLGNINLSNMVDFNGNVDYKRLARTVRLGVRFLDDVLTANNFPIPECREVGHRSRRIGLGVTGLHYFLIKAGYRYGDERCLRFLERVFTTIRDEAYKSSIKLAEEKGAFPAFDYKLFLKEEFSRTLPPRLRTDIKKKGIRNAVMLTVAPTGTISMLAGVSSGIEPIFAPMYKRRYQEGGVQKEKIIMDPLFEKYYLEGKDISNFVGAYDVNPEEHIKVQATIQKFIDSALSKTCNVPAHYTYADLKEVILEYAPYVKGFTVYRAGSKGNEPLEVIPTDNQEVIEAHLKIMKASTNEDDIQDVNCKSGVCEL
ncbi:adenosylcobalamin-dependent ribonucleoside-diphosphate reductase [Candidatus Woesearchaeota archaeon]|jgi:ribonucleoside-diphosphate reductase alpha chain|nr:adenosylcobalamin-dependent ribonucleoside-diphosphate reductase [Candidatus Woesearchaeota archaeon]